MQLLCAHCCNMTGKSMEEGVKSHKSKKKTKTEGEDLQDDHEELLVCVQVGEALFHKQVITGTNQVVAKMSLVKFMPHSCPKGPSKGRVPDRSGSIGLGQGGCTVIDFDCDEIVGDAHDGLAAKLATWGPQLPLPPGEANKAMTVESANKKQVRTQTVTPSHMEWFRTEKPVMVMEVNHRIFVLMLTHRGGESEGENEKEE